MARIVCVGLACLDYLFQVENLPSGGGKFFAHNYVAAPGGPAAAASIAAAALGHEAVFIGRLGDDSVAGEIINHLTARGVDTTNIHKITGQSSQVSSVIVDGEGERQIINYSSSQLDPDPSWLPEHIIASADVVLTDVRWPEGAERALRIAAENNISSIIDADIAPIDISHLVGLAKYAVFSERGLEMVSGEKELENGLLRAQQASNTWVGVTAGEKGSFWLENNTVCSCPAETIEAVDTCGAGDVFHGAFAVALAEGMDLAEAMRFSGATAALKCLQFGGSMGAPSRAKVDRLLAAG